MKELQTYVKTYKVRFDKQVTRIENLLFGVPQALKPYIKHNPAYIGQKIGMIRQERFIPSIDLLQWMNTHNAPSVTLNPEQEWRFICGNNIQRKELQTAEEGAVIVLNIHNECIGTGIIEQKYLKRTYDIGDLIRRERRKKTTQRF